MNRRIVIAAGHGGGDSGATGQGSCEAVECIQIVARLERILTADGRFEVVHVPDELGLQAEINWVNARFHGLQDGLAIEVHKNSGGGHGVEVFAYAGDKFSNDMAQAIADASAVATGLPNRGVKPHNLPALVARIGGPLGWIQNVTMYSLLVEAGFIDSDGIDDAADERFAAGIYGGILNIFQLAPIPAPTPAPAPAPATPEPGRGGLPEGVVPLDMPVEITAARLLVRDDANTSSASGVGQATGNADGNLIAGQVVTIKGYKRSQEINLSAKGGLHTDIWLLTFNYNWISATGTDFFKRMPDVLMLAPAAAPAPAPAAPTAEELYSARYGLTQLPGGEVRIWPVGDPTVRNMDTDSILAVNPTVPAAVRYAAQSNGDAYYVTQYSYGKQLTNGFRVDEWTTVAPVAASPVPAPTPEPAPVVSPLPPGSPLDGITPGAIFPPIAPTQASEPTLSFRERLTIFVAAILAVWPWKSKK